MRINPEERHGYAANPQRLGITREIYLGLAIVELERYCQYFHRYGEKESLEYLQSDSNPCRFLEKDETFQMIADKIYQADFTYDRLILKLNPEYELRLPIY